MQFFKPEGKLAKEKETRDSAWAESGPTPHGAAWPSGQNCLERPTRRGARSGRSLRLEPTRQRGCRRQKTRWGGAWWQGELQRGKIYLPGKGRRAGDHRWALAMARRLGGEERRCSTMVDGKWWSEVMPGWSYSTVEPRGVWGPKKINEKWPESGAHRGGAAVVAFLVKIRWGRRSTGRQR
jgi:hypothetical protein